MLPKLIKKFAYVLFQLSNPLTRQGHHQEFVYTNFKAPSRLIPVLVVTTPFEKVWFKQGVSLRLFGSKYSK